MNNKGVLKRLSESRKQLSGKNNWEFKMTRVDKDNFLKQDKIVTKIAFLMNILSNSLDITRLTSEDKLLLKEFEILNEEQKQNELKKLQTELYNSIPDGMRCL